MVKPAFLAPPEVDVLGGPTQALAHSVCEREGETNGRTDGRIDRQTQRKSRLEKCQTDLVEIEKDKVINRQLDGRMDGLMDR